MSAAALRAADVLSQEADASKDDAFAAFYQATARDLWAYVAASTGDPAAADDLTQEAFMRWLGASVAFESDEHRRRYLFRIASNLMQDKRRAAARRPEVPLDPDQDLADPQESSGERSQVAKHDVGRALARLKPRDRKILWLAHVEEASHAEIATMIGARSGSVRVLLFRARQRLAQALGGKP